MSVELFDGSPPDPIVSVHGSNGDLVFIKQSGNEIRIDLTPLVSMSGLSETQIDALVQFRIQEAEDRRISLRTSADVEDSVD